MVINKIIVVEGLDKTGKSTFCNEFERIYTSMQGINNDLLTKFSFPNATTPIGSRIRNELNTPTPNPDIVNTPNFLAEMSHFWMEELYKNTQITKLDETKKNNHITKDKKVNNHNYLFDRYFISTLAYQAFYNNSEVDLDFITTALKNNKFLKLPTDIIFLDLPNAEILKRTINDQQNNLTDTNDTLDENIINKRREAYFKALNFFKGTGVKVHWFEDVSMYSTEDLVKVLFGKIFG